MPWSLPLYLLWYLPLGVARPELKRRAPCPAAEGLHREPGHFVRLVRRISGASQLEAVILFLFRTVVVCCTGDLPCNSCTRTSFLGKVGPSRT